MTAHFNSEIRRAYSAVHIRRTRLSMACTAAAAQACSSAEG